ncbi:hypothetical protein [uncultured Tateyamaria sp.]|uniref:hypothetical protein n=1 Tax=uncultured Tateyamaria sp. TaxID=455651 RepID=UPI0026383E53|nr:hypothetical protein [uncultured Tateyamaria sp.]
MRGMLGILAVGAVACAGPVWAEALPMIGRGSLLTQARPLVAITPTPARASPSLFLGTEGKSLLSPPPQRLSAAPDILSGPRRGPLADLRSLIAKAEAGSKGYDAVQYGATIKPGAPPTTMTVQEIYDWIDDTPGQPHAIGRYQFIPPTLRRLVKRLGVDPKVRFTPRLQDQLADVLLAEAGLHDFLAGDMPRHSFMNNLAKIWAGLPNDTGKSHYHGYAGNKATMTWVYFDTQMARIFPG